MEPHCAGDHNQAGPVDLQEPVNHVTNAINHAEIGFGQGQLVLRKRQRSGVPSGNRPIQ